jgi:hypothetical protein
MKIRKVSLGHGFNKTLQRVEIINTQWAHDCALGCHFTLNGRLC